MSTVLSPPLEVYLLGLVDFDEAQSLQRRLVYDLGESRAAGALVLCEHPPTISIGRSGSRAHVAADDVELHRHGIDVRWVNRGGGTLLHLPGQLNAYLALDLSRAGLDLRGYLDGLHRAAVAVVNEFGLKGEAHPKAAGVFAGNARVASIGVAVRRWIAYHGLTINVGPFLEPFQLIDEPGPDGSRLRQTSLEAQRQRAAPMPKVRESLIRHLESTFGLTRHHVFTDHPMIRRKARLHAYAQSLG
ncbi:lipoyl(octanoyl) transferase LipB [Tautonia plasticadhaerens]|uniref:Octanoyltransferase n=1 Tax=Tautonia plasticadhaerens TaxID=2527974 RepID=A0A518HB56_9BACT|nr:lipoyl(octanoyl) transferase LipB [Tautonia plasticadhaerens]QDV38098.1 Octanoyltransferase [Tautonia plasticadhaerens]